MHIYGIKLSPFVMRPVLVGRAKGHEIETRMPDDAFRAASPIGKVPVLVDGDLILPESQIVAEYLDAVLDGAKMVAADPAVAARQRLACRLVDVYVVPELTALFRARENPEGVAPAVEKIGHGLGYIEHFRHAGDVFAVGDGFSIADAAMIPIFFFFDALGQSAVYAATPGLAAWWDRAKASDLGRQAIVEQDEGLKAMTARRAAASS